MLVTSGRGLPQGAARSPGGRAAGHVRWVPGGGEGANLPPHREGGYWGSGPIVFLGTEQAAGRQASTQYGFSTVRRGRGGPAQRAKKLGGYLPSSSDLEIPLSS